MLEVVRIHPSHFEAVRVEHLAGWLLLAFSAVGPIVVVVSGGPQSSLHLLSNRVLHEDPFPEIQLILPSWPHWGHSVLCSVTSKHTKHELP